VDNARRLPAGKGKGRQKKKKKKKTAGQTEI